jgi:formylglycine-generating enzyme required for sulfatase activity
VVGVTWFEAEAFANWLAKQLGCEVRLPTEYEWERAARGTKGREYAWGDTFDMNKVNCANFWEQKEDADWVFGDKGEGTSIVGQFKSGNTPEGISDLTGNVLEWTASWYEKEQTTRVVRGGSWDFYRRGVRCAVRGRLMPGDFFSSIGFRLVSPGSDSSDS